MRNSAKASNETIDEQQDILGNYAIPDSQTTIDRIVGELPENAQQKLYVV